MLIADWMIIRSDSAFRSSWVRRLGAVSDMVVPVVIVLFRLLVRAAH